MKQFLTWGQVQQRLIAHAQMTGQPYSFYDATRDLWEERKYQCAAELPEVPFIQWDCEDLDVLEQLLDQVPVDLDSFFQNFQKGLSSSDGSRRIIAFDCMPMRIAQYNNQEICVQDAFKIGYVIRGSIHLSCNDSSRHLNAGSLFILPPHFVHCISIEDNSLVLAINLSEQTVEDTLFRTLHQENIISDFFRYSLRETRGYVLFFNLDAKQVLPLFRNLLHEYYCPRSYSQMARASYLELLFVYLLRCDKSNFEQINSSNDQHNQFPILAILKHIQANYRVTSLSETAAIFHYNLSYMSKQIKICTGKNFSQIIKELRMADAKRLLQSTDMSIEQVAESAGFQSIIYFSKSFRECFGISPSAWRKRYQGRGIEVEKKEMFNHS